MIYIYIYDDTVQDDAGGMAGGGSQFTVIESDYEHGKLI